MQNTKVPKATNQIWTENGEQTIGEEMFKRTRKAKANPQAINIKSAEKDTTITLLVIKNN